MADIKYWRLDADCIRPTPVVNGTIHMEGQFSWEEWVAIRTMFLRMRSNPVPKPQFPSLQEIVARVQAGESPEKLIAESAKIPLQITDTDESAPVIDV